MHSTITDEQIRLNCEVIKVKYLSDSNVKLLVTVKNLISNKTSSISCNHVIWTTSLGHLKENFGTVFADESQLLSQKQSAINNLGFGTLNKVCAVVYG
jgi:hypothetical protein